MTDTIQEATSSPSATGSAAASPSAASWLQTLLDRASPGDVVTIPADAAHAECQGPIRIEKALTLHGNGCTLWSETGPVLVVNASGTVRLKDLSLEVTGDASEECAFLVERCDRLDLEDTHARGEIRGAGANRIWRYPRAVMLRLEPGQACAPIEITAPGPHTLRWRIAAIGEGEERRPEGTYVKTFTVPAGTKPGTSLEGEILLVGDREGSAPRAVTVAGWVRHATAMPSDAPAPDGEPIRQPATRLSPLLSAAMLFCLAAIAAIAWWWMSPPSRTRLKVSPTHLDWGTLMAGANGYAATTGFIYIACSSDTATNLHVTVNTTVYVPEWNLTNGPVTEEFALTGRVTAIPMEFDISDTGAGPALTVTGFMTVASLDTNVTITPSRIGLSAIVKRPGGS